MNKQKSVLEKFEIYGDLISAEPFGDGHINDTYVVTYNQSEQKVRYILRKINKYVFKLPELIVENTVYITNHIQSKMNAEEEKDVSRKVLSLIKAKDGTHSYIDENKDYWCVIPFIERAYTVNKVETTKQAYEGAKAYGRFQRYLFDIDIQKCHITIKNFHNISDRINVLDEELKSNSTNRMKEASAEISTFEKFKYIDELFQKFLQDNIPLRITHNDTKINNVMLNKKDDKGLCVVDLDTIMPGYIMNDFGDMVRSFVSPISEDETDIENIKVRLPIFRAIAEGYLSELKNHLTEKEISNLVLGAKIIVYEQAVRYLTDYLKGDVYYKTHYENQNLIRAKNQFKLLEEIIKNEKEMEQIINKLR